jgi:chromosome segregation ATPase
MQMSSNSEHTQVISKSSNDRINQLEAMLNQYQLRIGSLTQELESQTITLSNARHEKEVLQQSFSELSSALKKLHTDTAREKEELRTKMESELSTKVRQLRTEMEEAVKNAQWEKGGMEDEIRKFQMEAQHCKSALAVAQDQAKSWQSRFESQATDVEKLEAEVKRLKAKIDKEKEAQSNLEVELHKARIKADEDIRRVLVEQSSTLAVAKNSSDDVVKKLQEERLAMIEASNLKIKEELSNIELEKVKSIHQLKVKYEDQLATLAEQKDKIISQLTLKLQDEMRNADIEKTRVTLQIRNLTEERVRTCEEDKHRTIEQVQKKAKEDLALAELEKSKFVAQLAAAAETMQAKLDEEKLAHASLLSTKLHEEQLKYLDLQHKLEKEQRLYEKQKAAMQAEIDNLTDKLHKEREDRENIHRTTIHELNSKFEAKLGEVEEELSVFEHQARDEMKKKNELIDRITDECQDLKDQLSYLKEANKSISDLRKDLLEFKLEKARLTDTINSMTIEASNLSQELHNARAALNTANEKAKLYDEAIERMELLEKDLKEKSTKIFHLTRSVEDFQTSVGQEQLLNNQALEKVKHQKDKLARELEQALSEIDFLKNALDDQREQTLEQQRLASKFTFENLQTQVHGFASEKELFATELKSMEDRLIAERRKAGELQRALNYAEDNKEYLKTSVGILSKEGDEAKNILKELKEKNVILATTLEQTEKHKQMMRTMLDSRNQSEIEKRLLRELNESQAMELKLRIDISSLQFKLDQAAIQLQSGDDRHTISEKHLERARADLENVKAELFNCHSLAAALKRVKSDLEIENAKLLAQIAATAISESPTNATIDQCNKEITKLQDKIDQLEKQLFEKERLASDLEEELAKAGIDRTSHANSLRNASSEIQLYKNRVNELEKMGEQLRHDFTTTKEEISNVQLQKQQEIEEDGRVTNKAIEALTVQLESCFTDKGSLADEIKQLEHLLSEEKKKSAELQRALSLAKDSMELVQISEASNSKEISKLRESWLTSQQENITLATSCDQAKRLAEVLKSQLAAKEAALTAEATSSAQLAKNKLLAEISTCHQTELSLRNEVNSLKCKLGQSNINDETLKEQIKIYQDQLNRARAELEISANELYTTECLAAALKRSKADLEIEIQKLKAKMNAEGKFSNPGEAIKDIDEHQVTTLKSEVTALDKVTAEQKKASKLLEQELAKSKGELQRESIAKEATSAKLDLAGNRILQLEKDTSQLNSDFTEAQTKLTILHSQQEESEELARQSAENLAQEVAQLTKEKMLLSEEVQTLEKAVQKEKKVKTETEMKLEDMENKMEEVKLKEQSLERQLAIPTSSSNYHAEVYSIKDALHSEQQALHKSQTEKLQDKLKELSEQYFTAQWELTQAKKGYSNLLSILKKVSPSSVPKEELVFTTPDASVIQLNTLNGTLQDQLFSLQSKIDNQAVQAKNSEARARSAESRVLEVEKEAEKLRNKISSMQAQLSKEIAENKSEMQGRVLELEQELEIEKEKCQQFETKLQQLKTELVAAQNSEKKLAQQLDEKQKASKEQTEKDRIVIEDLESKLNEVECRLDVAQKTETNLLNQIADQKKVFEGQHQSEAELRKQLTEALEKERTINNEMQTQISTLNTQINEAKANEQILQKQTIDQLAIYDERLKTAREEKSQVDSKIKALEETVELAQLNESKLDDRLAKVERDFQEKLTQEREARVGAERKLQDIQEGKVIERASEENLAIQNEKMKDELQTLRRENSDLSVSLSQSQRIIDALKGLESPSGEETATQKLIKEVSKCHATEIQLNSQISALKFELEQSAEECNAAKQKVLILQDLLDKSKKELEKANDKLFQQEAMSSLSKRPRSNLFADISSQRESNEAKTSGLHQVNNNAEIAQLEERILQLDKDNRKSQSENLKLSQENVLLQAEVQSALTESSKLRLRIAEINKEHEQAVAKCTELQNQLGQSRIGEMQVQSGVKAANSTITGLKDEVLDMRQHILSTAEDAKKVEDKLAEEKKRAASLQKSLVLVEEQYQVAKSTLDSLKKEYEFSREQTRTAKQENSLMAVSLDQARKQVEIFKSSLSGQPGDLESKLAKELSDSQGIELQLRAQISDLQFKLDQAKLEISHAHDKTGLFKNQLEKSKSQLDAEMEEVLNNQMLVSSIKRSKSGVEAELSRTKVELITATKGGNIKDAIVEQTAKEVTKYIDQIHSLEKKIFEQDRTIKDLEEDLVQAELEKASQGQFLNTTRGELQRSRERIVELEKMLESLREEYSKCRADFSSWKIKVLNIESKASVSSINYEEQLKEKDELIKEKDELIEQLTRDCDQLLGKMVSDGHEFGERSAHMKKILKENKELCEEVNEAREFADKVKVEIQLRDEEIEYLTSQIEEANERLDRFRSPKDLRRSESEEEMFKLDAVTRERDALITQLEESAAREFALKVSLGKLDTLCKDLEQELKRKPGNDNGRVDSVYRAEAERFRILYNEAQRELSRVYEDTSHSSLSLGERLVLPITKVSAVEDKVLSLHDGSRVEMKFKLSRQDSEAAVNRPNQSHN